MSIAPFELIILKTHWSHQDMGNHAPKAFDALSAMDAGESVFTVTTDEIEAYDWDRQLITLTPGATDALLGNAEAQRAPEEVSALIDLKRRAGWGNRVESSVANRCFVVRTRGEFVYGGIFLEPLSQMGIAFPVARAASANGRARIALLPVHIPFMENDPFDESGASRELPIGPEAKTDIQALDRHDQFFTKWAHGITASDTATQFRRLIRDPRIWSAIAAAGKLKT